MDNIIMWMVILVLGLAFILTHNKVKTVEVEKEVEKPILPWQVAAFLPNAHITQDAKDSYLVFDINGFVLRICASDKKLQFMATFKAMSKNGFIDREHWQTVTVDRIAQVLEPHANTLLLAPKATQQQVQPRNGGMMKYKRCEQAAMSNEVFDDNDYNTLTPHSQFEFYSIAPNEWGIRRK